MRAIAYTRVSTDKQADAGNGLEAQTATIDKAVAARGWELVASMTDEGKSAKTMARPALADALDMLRAGKADVLVVSKMDRATRSVTDVATLLTRAKREGWALVALDLDVDTSTPTGELMANIYVSVAQWERRIIGQRTSEGMQAMKARGVRLGRPVKLAEGTRRRIAELRAEGKSLPVIANTLTAEGVPTARGGKWYPSTVRAVLVSLEHDAEGLVA